MGGWGDYGYMEEGRLGKPYNMALLKRLGAWAAPYWKWIVAALLASIVGTLFSLAMPYVSKVAIDQYIIAEWQRVSLDSPLAKNLPDSAVTDSTGKFAFLPHWDVTRMDPALVHEMRGARVLSDTAWYRVDPDRENQALLGSLAGSWEKAADGAVFLVQSRVDGLSKKDRLLLRKDDFSGVALMGLLIFAMIGGGFLMGFWEFIWLERAGQNIMNDIRMALFSHMQTQGLSFFDKNPTGRLTTRATNDVENLNEMFKSVMLTVFKDVFILAGIVAVMLAMDWRLALICFALIPPVFVFTLLFSTLARNAFRELRSTVAAINAFCQERFSAMATVQTFAAEAGQMKLFSVINLKNYKAGMRQIHVFAVFMPLMEFFATLGAALLIWKGGGMVLEDRVTLGTLVAFISYLRMFFRPLRDIAEKYNIMQSAMASTERIFEFMDTNEQVPASSHPRAPDKIRGRMEFEDVDFSYKEGQKVLDNVSFRARPGAMTALVGRTGAGKTSCVHLLLRFYDPESGRVTIDGTDIRDWPLEKLRASMALVSQDVFLFSASIEDNITLGAPSRGVSAREAAMLVGAHPFIERLEKGYGHRVSEGGANLSGGERQLLAFARALYFQTPILILDEATSSVDPQSERVIQKAVASMAKRCTMLVVAHRLSTIERADSIVVMEGGRVAETGNHERLLAQKGAYWRLRQLLSPK